MKAIRHPHGVVNFGSSESQVLDELNDAAVAARSAGWQPLDASVDQLAALIDTGQTPYEIVRARRTDSAVSVLTPIEQSDAGPRSLSGTYGTGEFPLHTDGAHLDDPPEFTILESEGSENEAATTLHRFITPGTTIRSSLRLGIFRVESGAGRGFYAPILDPNTDAVRYDPNCMFPADWRAYKAAEYMKGLVADQHHRWGPKRQTLIVCNRSALHGREPVISPEKNRTLRRIMIRKKVNFGG